MNSGSGAVIPLLSLNSLTTMATRRFQKTRKEKEKEKGQENGDDYDYDYDFDFDLGPSLSQQSSSSADDHSVQLAIAEQLLAAKEKKKKEKESKFLVGAKKHLSQEVDDNARTVLSASQSAEEIYSQFTLAYAENEDKIRKIWVEIQNVQYRFSDHHRRRQDLAARSETQSEKAFVDALARQRTAINDMDGLRDSLSPQVFNNVLKSNKPAS